MYNDLHKKKINNRTYMIKLRKHSLYFVLNKLTTQTYTKKINSKVKHPGKSVKIK